MNLHLPPNKTPYFSALTGVRALAAYMVFLHHHKLTLPILDRLVSGPFQMGITAVTMFFVLSGFLISYRYADFFEAGKVDFRKYLGYRFARIYPLYLFLTIIILVWSRNFSLWEWFLNFTLLKGFFEQEKFSGIFQAWTLTVEECFYFSAPLLFGLFRKYGIFAVPGILGSGAIFVLLAQAAGSESFMASQSFMLVITFFGRCFEFYCGYWLAKQIKSGKPWLRTQANGFYTYLGLGLLFAGLLMLNLIANKEIMVVGDISLAVLVNNFMLPLCITIFYLGLVLENSFISKVLGTPLMQILGRSSFAFYLIHAGLFAEYIYFHISKNPVLIFVILNLVAVVLYFFLEQPANKFIRQKLQSFPRL